MGAVFVCICAGSALQTVAHFAAAGGKISPNLFYPAAAATLCCLIASIILIILPWKFERLLARLVAMMGCLYPGLLLMVWLQKEAGPVVPHNSVGATLMGTLCFQGAALVLVGFLLRQLQVSWDAAFGLSWRWEFALVVGLLAGSLFVRPGWSLQAICFYIVDHFSHSPALSQEQAPVQVLRIASSISDRIALGGVTILLAPVAEELLFRGIIYTWLKKAGFPRIALWGTALAFGAIHGNLVAFLPLFVFAILLTLLYEFTNNLLAPIAAHAFFNAANFYMLYKQTG